MDSVTDYAVVGAGPAGALAASSLAQRGRQVLLFHWRPKAEKPCGGGVPSQGMRRFGHLLEGIPRNRIHSVRLVGPGGAEARIPLGEPLHIFARSELDAGLRRHAVSEGAQLIEARVIRHTVENGTQELLAVDAAGRTRSFRVRFVVSADGAAGFLRKKLLREAGCEPDNNQFSRSFTSYPRTTASDELEIAWVGGRDGYAWTFPRTNHASVGICEQGRLGSNRGLFRDLQSLIRSRRLTGNADEPGIGALIPSYRSNYLRQLPVEGPGFALVGDAAGCVDPITREGIHHAMASGWQVGIADPLDQSGRYQSWYEQELRPELLHANRWAPRFFRPRFLEIMVHALHSSPRLRSIFGDLVAGSQPYGSLSRRLLDPRIAPALVRGLWKVRSLSLH